jgi:proline-specific peptidase
MNVTSTRIRRWLTVRTESNSDRFLACISHHKAATVVQVMKLPTKWRNSQRGLMARLPITRPRRGASEGEIAVPGGKVWFRRVGSGTGLPLLVIHGGPGFPHDYLSSLQRLADEREIIFWDQLGCGRSEKPSDERLWTLSRSMAELDSVINALGLAKFHLFGHSWGGMLAQQYVLDSAATRVASLTLSNSLASVPRFSHEVCRLKDRLDEETQLAIDHHEGAGTIDSAEYQAALRIWFETHICRALPWPRGLETAYRSAGRDIYETLFGRSHFHFDGQVRGWDVFDRLSKIRKPTLIIAGRFDECTPEHMWDIHHCIARSRFVLFDSSSHMPFIEEPERFDNVMRYFLRSHEGC